MFAVDFNTKTTACTLYFETLDAANEFVITAQAAVNIERICCAGKVEWSEQPEPPAA